MVRHIALVPAAGSGSRFPGVLPKQYQPLAGRPMIHHPLATLSAVAEISSIFVLLHPDDQLWDEYRPARSATIIQALRCGGATRAATVRAGLESLAGDLAHDDWVLVHDAARPCISLKNIAALMERLRDDEIGGLLALPAADTLKSSSAGRVAGTVAREGLWQAQTPQMFRYGVLRRALLEASEVEVTDESQAVEALGLRPLLVQGDAANLKITYPRDLALAEAILRAREPGNGIAP